LFEPQGEKHAIIEVVFGLRFARNFTPAEIEALIAAHGKFKDDLPKINRTQIFQFSFGDGEPPANLPFTPPVAGVAFDAMKKDGTLDWRLKADDNAIFVNCLSYSRWKEVWAKAQQFLRTANEIVVNDDNPVTAVLLQYIDVFRWTADKEKYDLRLMLDEESQHIPKSIYGCGPFWHLHQGWYRDDKLPAPGRMLERVHLDALLDDKGVPTVKLDTYLQLELAKPQSGATVFGTADALGDKVYSDLHEVNKALLRSVLTKELAKRIGLDE